MPSSGARKMMKIAVWAGAQLLEQIVIHDHLGNAATWQAADEAGAPNIGLVDLQPEPGGKQHAHGGDDTHEPALLVGGLEHHHGEADTGAIFRHDRLHERALLLQGAGWWSRRSSALSGA